MKCDIIIPVWDQPVFTKNCVEHVFKNTDYPYRLIVIDNGSRDQTRQYLSDLQKKHPDKVVVIRNDHNLGFVKAVNQGLARSDAPYVCLLNNDTLAAPGWLSALVEFAEEHKDAGLLNPVCDGHLDRSIEEYAAVLKANKGRYMEMNQCFGFCMLIKREVIDAIGHLDEAFGIGGFDDTDYSMRAHKAGYRSVCVHSSYVYHKQHVSFKAMGDRKKLVSAGEKAYFKKWPRHLRIGVSVGVDARTGDEHIENILKTVLYLAREWCWINLWILGDAAMCKERIRAVSQKTGFPSHQNIKFNYMRPRLESLQLAVKLLERSFGTKRRKKYDAVLLDRPNSLPLLRMLSVIHATHIGQIAFNNDTSKYLQILMSELHKKG